MSQLLVGVIAKTWHIGNYKALLIMSNQIFLFILIHIKNIITSLQKKLQKLLNSIRTKTNTIVKCF